ncbi:hypothetical protein [Priestia aryabhattai]
MLIWLNHTDGHSLSIMPYIAKRSLGRHLHYETIKDEWFQRSDSVDWGACRLSLAIQWVMMRLSV